MPIECLVNNIFVNLDPVLTPNFGFNLMQEMLVNNQSISFQYIPVKTTLLNSKEFEDTKGADRNR